jgi:hypothetical protein
MLFPKETSNGVNTAIIFCDPYKYVYVSQDNSVSTVTRLRAGQLRNQGLIPGRGMSTICITTAV